MVTLHNLKNLITAAHIPTFPHFHTWSIPPLQTPTPASALAAKAATSALGMASAERGGPSTPASLPCAARMASIEAQMMAEELDRPDPGGGVEREGKGKESVAEETGREGPAGERTSMGLRVRGPLWACG